MAMMPASGFVSTILIQKKYPDALYSNDWVLTYHKTETESIVLEFDSQVKALKQIRKWGWSKRRIDWSMIQTCLELYL